MSLAVAVSGTVAKRRGRPKLEPEAETTPVRIRKRIVRRAEWVALARGITVSQLISDYLEPLVDRDYKKVEKPD